MELERVAVAIRPRNDWEAIDLGLRLAQRHGGRVWPLWFVASAPWFLVIGTAGILAGYFWQALLVLWWIKPMFERVLLHVFGRVVFDDQPAQSEFFGIAFRRVFGPGLASALTYRRFEPARSFNLPVWQLERLTGRDRRRRSSVLQMGTGATAVVLSLVSAALVFLAFATLTFLALALATQQLTVFQPLDAEYFLNELIAQTETFGKPWQFVLLAIYWLSEGLIAPFYSAAGFSLYLNRRTHLEAWDVELEFRRLIRRRNLAGVVVAIVLACGLPPTPSHAQDLEQERADVRSQITQIVDNADFGEHQTHTRWVLKSQADEEEDAESAQTFESASPFARLLAVLTESILWVLVAALCLLLFIYRAHWLGWMKGSRVPLAKRRNVDGSLLLDADEMPDDVPAQVRTLWQSGRQRDALSLLYRGALTVLDERHELRIGPSDTEGDCERRVLQQLDEETAGYFARIANHWQRIAYAHQSPSEDQVDELCHEWRLIGASHS